VEISLLILAVVAVVALLMAAAVALVLLTVGEVAARLTVAAKEAVMEEIPVKALAAIGRPAIRNVSKETKP
jgi:hypothetical protein